MLRLYVKGTSGINHSLKREQSLGAMVSSNIGNTLNNECGFHPFTSNHNLLYPWISKLHDIRLLWEENKYN